MSPTAVHPEVGVVFRSRLPVDLCAWREYHWARVITGVFTSEYPSDARRAKVPRYAVALAMAALCTVAGCSDEADDIVPRSNGDQGATVVFLAQRVLGFTLSSGEIGPPESLAGARVCISSGEVSLGCTESGDDGSYRLEGLPKYSLLVITAEHEGYIPVVEPYITLDVGWDVTGEVSLHRHIVLLPEGAESIVGPPDTVREPERGSIVAFAMAGPPPFPPATGLSVDLDGASPAYFGDETELLADGGVIPGAGQTMRYLPGAVATVGGFAAGLPAGAIFWNVAPGFHDVAFHHPSAECQRLRRAAGSCGPQNLFCPGRNFYGYPTEEASTLRVPVLAGFMTRYAAALCL